MPMPIGKHGSKFSRISCSPAVYSPVRLIINSRKVEV